MENLRRRLRVEREVAERDYERRVAAERAKGEERRRLDECVELAEKAKEVRKS